MPCLPNTKKGTQTRFPAKQGSCNRCWKKGHHSKVFRIKQISPEDGRKTEDVHKPIQLVKAMKQVQEKEDYIRKRIEINRDGTDFIFLTGSPITILPKVQGKHNLLPLTKLTSKYRNVNKNEVKFFSMNCESWIRLHRQTITVNHFTLWNFHTATRFFLVWFFQIWTTE